MHKECSFNDIPPEVYLLNQGMPIYDIFIQAFSTDNIHIRFKL